jgi:hypothetical protein
LKVKGKITLLVELTYGSQANNDGAMPDNSSVISATQEKEEPNNYQAIKECQMFCTFTKIMFFVYFPPKRDNSLNKSLIGHYNL